jgi:predicted dehydrogenase
MKLRDGNGEIVESNFKATRYDFISLLGRLEKSGAPVNISFRPTAGKPVDEDVGIRWVITGDDGEAELLIAGGQFQVFSPVESLRIRAGKDSKVRNVDLDGNDGDVVAGVGPAGKNVARAYEAFANKEDGKYADFEDALKLHKLLDQIENRRV